MEGYDTVALSFAVNAPDTQPGASLRLVLGDRGDLAMALGDARTLRKLPSGGTLRTGVGGRGVVEVSSKYQDESAYDPTTWGHAVRSLRSAFEEATAYVAAPDPFEAGRIVRVDAVRDFDGGHGWPQLATSLVGAVGYPRARSRLFRDRDRGNSLSLAVGNTGWRSGIYDKHAESMGRAPQGRLRYEYRQGREWCQKLGVSLESPGGTHERAKRLFAECRFGATVSGMYDVLAKVLEASGLSSSEQLRMMGWLYAESAGVVIAQSSRTAAKYRRLARDLGLVVGDVPAGDATACLDYDAGRMVTSIAA